MKDGVEGLCELIRNAELEDAEPCKPIIDSAEADFMYALQMFDRALAEIHFPVRSQTMMKIELPFDEFIRTFGSTECRRFKCMTIVCADEKVGE